MEKEKDVLSILDQWTQAVSIGANYRLSTAGCGGRPSRGGVIYEHAGTQFAGADGFLIHGVGLARGGGCSPATGDVSQADTGLANAGSAGAT